MTGDSTPVPQHLWQLAPVGDTGWLVSWRGAREDAGAAVRQLTGELSSQPPAGLVETVAGIDSLLVCYDPLHPAATAIHAHLAELLPVEVASADPVGTIVSMEVDYGGADGPDLPEVARACGLAEDEVVALHTARPMPVLMIGFMPGFPYIGELPAPLRLPRRAEPRTAVPAGSVAIANDQTGIYPRSSPGGWHIIGRTAARLFDPHADPPTLLRPGAHVRFVPRRSR